MKKPQGVVLLLKKILGAQAKLGTSNFLIIQEEALGNWEWGKLVIVSE